MKLLQKFLSQNQKSLEAGLNYLGKGFYSVYREGGLSKAHEDISYTPLEKDLAQNSVEKYSQVLSEKIKFNPYGKFDPSKTIIKFAANDIENSKEDEFGNVILVLGKGENLVRYGNYGIAPSALEKPEDLLKHSLLLPELSVGVLSVKTHTPFKLVMSEKSFAFPASEMLRVTNHEENISRYSINVLSKLTADDAKRLTLLLQTKIFSDYSKENFYEEITSVFYKPTEHNKSSGTLMNFEQNHPSEDLKTASHYHPGERSLIIFTNNKKAGATLNFCGVDENPDERPDCKASLTFQENSITILNFPPYTHHKFSGEFIALSIHPREGANLIEAVQNGKISKGFLETATVFSKT